MGIAVNLPKDILLTSSIVMKVTPQMFLKNRNNKSWSKFFGGTHVFPGWVKQNVTMKLEREQTGKS